MPIGMDRLFNKLGIEGARVTSVLIAVALGVYGLFLLVVGQPWVGVGSAGTSVQWHSAPAAVLIVAGAVILLVGLLKRTSWVMWLGFAWLLIFGMLFVFGIGGALLPPLGALLAFLALIQTQRILVAWSILSILVAFSLYARVDFAIPILSIAGLILMLLTIAKQYANHKSTI
jgi:hypothetical protein